MKVAIIARATLHTVKGGDTIQVIRTAEALRELGISAEIKTTNELIAYEEYDLLHFFNIIRPADILPHIHNNSKPVIVSPILVDYSEFDKYHRKGLGGLLFRFLSSDAIEYVKTILRWILGRDVLRSKLFVWKGQRGSIKEILKRTAVILPNSAMEYEKLVQRYSLQPAYEVVPNGVEATVFRFNDNTQKDKELVLCVGRIEGIKNQLTLIQALSNTKYKLVIVGAPTPGQQAYYRKCREAAGPNITFIGHLPQGALVPWYQKAKVHILPSWFETCGLSTLEAAMMGCNIIITDKGYTREYFEDYAVYCDPGDPQSIYDAVEKAATQKYTPALREKISSCYTWQQAAHRTLEAYKRVLA